MKKSLEWFLERGFDLEAAKYFAYGSKKIIKISPKEDYTIDISFDNGELRVIDLSDIKDEVGLEEFLKAKVDGGIVFNGGFDICADYCYLNSKQVRS